LQSTLPAMAEDLFPAPCPNDGPGSVHQELHRQSGGPPSDPTAQRKQLRNSVGGGDLCPAEKQMVGKSRFGSHHGLRKSKT